MEAPREFARMLCDEIMFALHQEMTRPEPEKPLDTTSAYFGRRYCTSCVKEWGDVDLLLDLMARRTGQQRHVIYPTLRDRQIICRGACCSRAVMGPGQHDIGDYSRDLFLDFSGRITSPPSAIRISATRPLLGPNSASGGVAPLMNPVSLMAVENLLTERVQ